MEGKKKRHATKHSKREKILSLGLEGKELNIPSFQIETQHSFVPKTIK
jgi:hypothetical protein